ncbi:Hint domain-containing protein [Frigidibacter oleivorans]|uniref:Hint domain-containing protein n=1 Tax=Frigidibacter oleivorans TaxID=2487129 RepID=UPI000F8DD42F|nr:Hint domain-containing protein [Frigidibacter oleivorans]
MTPSSPLAALAGLSAEVFAAGDIRVVAGANQGDGLEAAGEAQPGDIYRLAHAANPRRLLLAPPGPAGGPPCIAEGSFAGQPGEAVTPLWLATLMAPSAEPVEVLTLRLEDSGEVLALPLSPVARSTDYELLSALPPPADLRLSDMACASFAGGTRIALASGALCPVEDLAPDDRVLTRDSGPQPIRWIGRVTQRAAGRYAPVAIAPGTLGNLGELRVSQHHRLFLYQRQGPRLAGTAELLVPAMLLADGAAIRRVEGGYVDYYTLVFDRHEIVYAEGIPCESLQVSEATLPHLPAEIAEDVRRRFPGLEQRLHYGSEAGAEAARLIRGG